MICPHCGLWIDEESENAKAAESGQTDKPKELRRFTTEDVRQAVTHYLASEMGFAEMLLIAVGFHTEQQVLTETAGACIDCGRPLI
jgi:uncharacterized Zn finger protein (UPF0148 family)